MAQAISTHTTPRRRPEDAATITLMLLKASVLGPERGAAAADLPPRRPAPVTGAARALEVA